MEAAGGARLRERRDQGQAARAGAGEARRGQPLSGTSYWLDLWLFLLLDLLLFAFVYLLP